MDPILSETLTALDMPPQGLEKWFLHLQRKCASGAGPRYYRELAALLDECQAALAEERRQGRL
jgi:hypothetical protein